MKKLQEEISEELYGRILPFWLGPMRSPDGEWYGSMDCACRPMKDAPRGCILNARILWTFSSAFRLSGRQEYLQAASSARDYILSHFIDREYGGAFWSVNPDGTPHQTKKQFYAIAFVIYALAEYSRATGESPDEAVALFRCIEAHSADRNLGGYFEALSREWSPLEDVRLSARDRDDVKTMNTHLHILEAYTALCRVWPDTEMKDALRRIIGIFMERIVRPDGHLALFFTENWQSTCDMLSYGHDIEASWLLCEAAAVLGDDALSARVCAVSMRIASASLEGLGEGMIYERDPSTGHLDEDRHWWVQAETVLGCLNQYELTGEEQWRTRALGVWEFIKKYLRHPAGEWYWSAKPLDTGGFVPNTSDDLAGFWKCPYHNGRMCMEIIEKLK